MEYRVEWDPDKGERNLRKHDVSFDEAATVLNDPLSITLADPDHSEVDERFSAVGAFEVRTIPDRQLYGERG